MRTILAFAICGAAAVSVVTNCDRIVGGPPREIAVAADTSGTKVQITWSPPSEGTPDRYLVYFSSARDSGYVMLDATGDTTYLHDPEGETGTYRVEAQFGGETYRPAGEPSTVPVFTDTVTVSILGGSGNPGFGWNRAGGAGATSPMLDLGDTVLVDLYVTRYENDSIHIASPDMAPGDTAGNVPPGEWRENSFTRALPTGHDPLPKYNSVEYVGFRPVADTSMLPMTVGCWLEDGRFALVRITGVNRFVGEVRMQSWYQRVTGLRLLYH
ncbi:MAG: hypothetical protein JSU73_06600 [candidate division WOR-3 bacterium]|nr:MAG: hypothetical protein JSU73_06600 [candidate division WOR-3 bacterium]